MEWYWEVIFVLSVAWLGSLAFVVHLVGELDVAREESAKLRLTLKHKSK
jgi:anti-anti-sigma regulatory factor